MQQNTLVVRVTDYLFQHNSLLQIYNVLQNSIWLFFQS